MGGREGGQRISEKIIGETDGMGGGEGWQGRREIH